MKSLITSLQPTFSSTCLKTMARRLNTACVALLVLLALPAAVQAQDYSHTTENGQITLHRYTGPGGAVVIPGTINSLPVTQNHDEEMNP